jgi:hypothetical protein
MNIIGNTAYMTLVTTDEDSAFGEIEEAVRVDFEYEREGNIFSVWIIKVESDEIEPLHTPRYFKLQKEKRSAEIAASIETELNRLRMDSLADKAEYEAEARRNSRMMS